MVEPTTPDVTTLRVARPVLARADAAKARLRAALEAAACEQSVENYREAAAARYELAEAYRALASEFLDSPSLFSALLFRSRELVSEANQYQQWADLLGGGL